jgi:hypothetical protein
MNKHPHPIRILSDTIDQTDHMDCFGDFNRTNPLCSKYCGLRLRCAIEQDQNMRLELIEDLVTVEGQLIKIQ